ncbi:metallo proteinase 10 [Marasmius fiardii PR-910]|nr:metallo proteinase 10 [Marasmius fiardii PR-910]
MSFNNLFFVSVLVAVLCASVSDAAPWPVASKHATHRKRLIGRRGIELETFHPSSQFQVKGKLMANAQNFAKPDGLKSNVMTWLSNNLQVNTSALEWTSGWSANGNSFGYVKQIHEGIPFANAVANVAFKGDNAVSFGNSFVDTTKAKVAPSTPKVKVEDAVATAEATLAGTHNGIEPALQYLAQADGSVALVHAIQIQNEEDESFVEAYVDAHSGKVVSVNDFVADATFRVLPIDKKLIADGLQLLRDPEGLDASPNGWNNDGQQDTTDTSGNNVLVFKQARGRQAQSTLGTNTGGSLTFDFTYDPTKAPNDPENLDAARTNAFFLANEFHDILYRYGFTENQFNFQIDNFGKGGRGNDPVLMSVQDASGFNNANFATPPDGQSGQCRMFIWNLLNPNQDGAMENSIPIHELAHGLTNRMTGGGTGRCLQSLQAGGMGEGWSDAVANWMTQTSANTQDFVLGQGVTGAAGGIRSNPYSVSAQVNPLKYSDIGRLREVHQIGEVWANTLHTVYADLVDELGFTADAKTNADAPEGNAVFMKLMVTALTLQPCNPTVLDARDAFIQADQNLNNGANECTLRASFAKKGLGLNATPDFQDDDTVPANCN